MIRRSIEPTVDNEKTSQQTCREYRDGHKSSKNERELMFGHSERFNWTAKTISLVLNCSGAIWLGWVQTDIWRYLKASTGVLYIADCQHVAYYVTKRTYLDYSVNWLELNPPCLPVVNVGIGQIYPAASTAEVYIAGIIWYLFPTLFICKAVTVFCYPWALRFRSWHNRDGAIWPASSYVMGVVEVIPVIEAVMLVPLLLFGKVSQEVWNLLGDPETDWSVPIKLETIASKIEFLSLSIPAVGTLISWLISVIKFLILIPCIALYLFVMEYKRHKSSSKREVRRQVSLSQSRPLFFTIVVSCLVSMVFWLLWFSSVGSTRVTTCFLVMLFGSMLDSFIMARVLVGHLDLFDESDSTDIGYTVESCPGSCDNSQLAEEVRAIAPLVAPKSLNYMDLKFIRERAPAGWKDPTTREDFYCIVCGDDSSQLVIIAKGEDGCRHRPYCHPCFIRWSRGCRYQATAERNRFLRLVRLRHDKLRKGNLLSSAMPKIQYEAFQITCPLCRAAVDSVFDYYHQVSHSLDHERWVAVNCSVITIQNIREEEVMASSQQQWEVLPTGTQLNAERELPSYEI